VFVLFVYEISQEPLNRFAPNSLGRRVFFPRSDEFVGQGQISKVIVSWGKNGIFWHFRLPAFGLFGKTSLASS